MKKFIILVVVLCLIPYTSFADVSIEEVLENEITKIDLNELEDIYQENRLETFFGTTSLKETVLQIASGKISFKINEIIDYVLFAFRSSFKALISNIVIILSITIMCTLISNVIVDESFNVKKVSKSISFLVILIVLINFLTSYVKLISNVITTIQSISRLIFPLILTLTTALGSLSSIAVFEPMITILNNGIIEFMINCILPLSTIGTTTALLGGINDRIQLKKLSEFSFSMCKWLLGIVSIIFLGFMGMKGFMASAFDTISIKTAKYAVNSFVPIVGGMMSDTVETMLGCSVLLKNSIGVLGIVIIIFLLLSPIIQILTSIVLYKILCVLVDVIGDKELSNAISGMTNGMTMLFAICIIVIMLMFITITIMISLGNQGIV